MMDERSVETSLRRYRPITKLPLLTLRPSRTWPWALAAAVLLVLSLGLHGRPESDDNAAPVDAQRLQEIRADLADTPYADLVASWMAYREAIDEQPASGAHDRALIDQMPELR